LRAVARLLGLECNAIASYSFGEMFLCFLDRRIRRRHELARCSSSCLDRRIRRRHEIASFRDDDPLLAVIVELFGIDRRRDGKGSFDCIFPLPITYLRGSAESTTLKLELRLRFAKTSEW
jgi:hypothetical protein